MKLFKFMVVFFINFISFNGFLCSNDIVKAVQNSDLNTLQRLITQGHSLFLRGKMSGKSLFFRTSDPAMLDFLLQHGLEIDLADYSGATPLIDAIKNDDNSKVGYLFNHGANINITDLHNRSALWHAIHQQNDGLVHYLVENGAQLMSEMIQMAHDTYQNYRNILEAHRVNGVDEDQLYRIRELFYRARSIKSVLEERLASLQETTNNLFIFMLKL